MSDEIKTEPAPEVMDRLRKALFDYLKRTYGKAPETNEKDQYPIMYTTDGEEGEITADVDLKTATMHVTYKLHYDAVWPDQESMAKGFETSNFDEVFSWVADTIVNAVDESPMMVEEEETE